MRLFLASVWNKNATTRPMVADCFKYFDRLLVVCNFLCNLFRISNFENRTTESKVGISFGFQIPSPKKVLKRTCFFSENILYSWGNLEIRVFFSYWKQKIFQKRGKWQWVLKMLVQLIELREAFKKKTGSRVFSGGVQTNKMFQLVFQCHYPTFCPLIPKLCSVKSEH